MPTWNGTGIITQIDAEPKFFENILHFLHHKGKCIVIIDDFGCRIGCRIWCKGVGYRSETGEKGVNSLRFPGEKWQEVELLCTILPKAWILWRTCKKTVFAKYLWVSEQGRLSRWYPYTTVYPFYCPVFRKGLFSISRSDRKRHWICPPRADFLCPA